MTDNEIVKAWGNCLKDNVDCAKCPLIHEDCHETILNLINRQKAEIKEWKRVVETWQMQHEKDKAEIEKNENIIRLADKTIETANAEIERLQQYYDDMQGAIYEFREDHAKVKFFKKEIKAEAYRKFAERLKEKSSALARLWIDNELKELVGEDDE